MRDIKFRAFIKWAKLILEVESIDFKRKRVYCKTELGKPNPCDFYNFDDIELMQYTGLIEIYEGDIVKIEKCFTNGVDKLSDHTGEIKYSNCRFVAIDEYLNSLCPYTYKNQIEVIGNIYENPELLKEGN